MSNARALDQFYTARPVAQACMAHLAQVFPLSPKDIFLEPSAGDGAFYEQMPVDRRVGMDLEPKLAGIAQGDFLKAFQTPTEGRWITLGNPPFGKNSSLAVKFFNRAAEFSEVVAFVVPLTFRKHSLQKRLNAHFVLISDIDLPAVAFVFEGQPYSVPCCFQVWQRSVTARVVHDLPLTHVDFEFCSAAQADFAIRRVGVLAGKVLLDFEGYSPASHYFIRSNIQKKELVSRFRALSWDGIKGNTAGNPSISKRELVAQYTKRAAVYDLKKNYSLNSSKVASP